MAGIPGSENGKYSRGDAMTVLVPRGSFEIIDNWGDIIGMRGSGSNSVRITDVFVPDDMVFFHTIGAMVDGPTPGSVLHGDAFFGGAFGGFAEGGLRPVALETGVFAALDEYEELLRTKKSVHKDGIPRLDDPEFLRKYGMALASLQVARGAVLNGAETYLSHCELSVSGQQPFDGTKCAVMDGAYHACENIVFDVIDSLARAASSTAFRQGQRMQRYYRDILTLTSRADFFEFRAADVARTILAQNAASSECAV
ncbi:pigment production hydroxylase-like [Teleopsis dalmanni]|uniref:pigment production hydroxylase-like n=1 Tax=Teleopsis dalmanni TaxID=139649 RepID=UPI0018CCAD45|nr:pigment production hydroxylase-like [Teleopsis dalmanni]